MHFNPVLLPSNIFSAADKAQIAALVKDDTRAKKRYTDDRHGREIRRIPELEIFSAKLLDIAREVFGDPTLKSTYSVHLAYGPDSTLTFHKDHNACVYTIDYCVVSNVDWPLVVEDTEFDIPQGRALAFMGGHDLHGRNEFPKVDNGVVSNIMFHFCPEDHWYFTEGPGYFRVLAEKGEIPTY